MVWIGIIVLLGFIVLGCLSRREEGGLLERMAVYLYKKGCIYKLPMLNARSVQKDLESLYPGQSGMLLQGDYYRQKLRMLLLVLGIGTLLGVLTRVRAVSGGALTAQGELLRPELGSGEKQVELEAELEGEKTGRFTVSVQERQLTQREAQELYLEFWEKLRQEALGDNPSWQQVSAPLILAEELEGYPFSVSWRSSDYERIGTGGQVHVADNPQTVTLTAEIRYLDSVWQEELTLLVVPERLEGADLLAAQVREAYRLAAEEAVTIDRVPLPLSIDGKPLVWREVREDYSLVLLLMTVCTAAAIFLFRDRDLHRQVLLRREKMKEVYPVVVSKLTLYLGAGMTIRGAFRKIADDYSRRDHKGKEQPLYEEMLYACNQLQAGISESRIYEMWAARTGLQDCARLSAMLAQNLKKGNAALLSRLKEEGDRALQEELNLRRRKGEEAGTRLLVPMIMMMAIVMVLVMIPAFQSFGI
ncbi:MAG: type II secretion system F family protein [bacterium]|nr:type II secretion system F family protein [bacterium]MCM1374697.1 type II secretion system F family protein [Muribaculum sp.]